MELAVNECVEDRTAASDRCSLGLPCSITAVKQHFVVASCWKGLSHDNLETIIRN